MKSAVVKRSIKLDGRKTSISLEDVFWNELKEIAHFQDLSVSSLVTAIAARTEGNNLSSAIRVFVVEHLQNKDKRASPPHTVSAVSSDESRSPQAWRGFAKRG
jgi:predicted DNA-binding ribbon-helix-helix protein